MSVVAIFKNEARYLDEWLAFCIAEGVEHVLLYDHSSTDNANEVLQPWIDAGIVELIDWPVPWKTGAQTKAYLHALGRLRGRTRWAAFIDIDEFLFSPTGAGLPQVLKRYEGYAGVVVNWQCYGTSGHQKRPPELTIESYTRRARTDWARNRWVKTIVDPLLAVTPEGPHPFALQRAQSLVTEDFTPVQFARTTKWRRRLRFVTSWLPYLPFDPYSMTVPSMKKVSISTLRINHYATRSSEDLQLKYKDRRAMRDWDRYFYSRYHDRNEVNDPILLPKARQIREIIARVREVAAPFRIMSG